MSQNKVTIVVGSVDKYSQAWPAFKHGFKKYWPDCPWEVVAITNFKDFPVGRTIKIGEDKSWADSVRKGMEQIDSDVILWMMEDYWLTGPVNTEYMLKYAKLLLEDKIDHIRLLPPAPGLDVGAPITPDLECKHPYCAGSDLWVFQDDAEYRASLACSLWRKDVFLKFLKEGTTPWEFEHNAGIMSRGNDRHLCCINPKVISWPWRTNPYPNGKESPIRKGQWTGAAHQYNKYESVGMNLQWHPNRARVSENVRIRNWKHFYIGAHSIIDDFCYISTKIEIGKYTHICPGCTIAGGQDYILQIRDYCSIASGVKIYCASNDYKNDLVILNPGFDYGEKVIAGNIDIGNYVGIGANTVIMPNCQIGEGVVIGAQSFVPPGVFLPPWTVWAGIPVKKIGERNKKNVLRQVERIKQHENRG